MKIPVNKISPNPQQPRTYFDEEYIKSLAQSIKKNGLKQPILVEANGGGKYTLVSGECRWRAHKLIGWAQIEATVRQPTNHSGKARLVDAMIENVARNNMNVVDEARGYLAMRKMKMSIRQISITVGKREDHIRNRLLITELDPEIQERIAEGALPHTVDAVNAFLAIKNSKTRVQVAERLAARRASTRIIVKMTGRYMEAKSQAGKTQMEMPALEVARMTKQPPEWDALYQIGKVPSWQKFTESVMQTCDNCALRPMASEATCGSCPVVDLCRRLMEKTKK